jgi:hypothetical protein
MQYRFLLTGIAAALGLACVAGSQSEKQPPVSLDQLLEWASAPEAVRPSEEIIESLRKWGTAFPLNPASEARVRATAETARRPDDLVRQIVQATRENWILDQVRLLVRKKEALPQIAEMVRERDVRIPYSTDNERALLDAGADEPALTLLWPPLPPEKPRFQYQGWRTPKQNVDPVPIQYDPNQVRGEVEIDAIVDGRVMFVLKHDTIFYNVICGADLQMEKAHFSGPLPRLPEERWEYRVDISKKKPRGKVFACPQDKECAKAAADTRKNPRELLCSWEDLAPGADEHGYSNPRFLIDDPQSGAAAYSVTFQWAVKPYTLEWFVEDVQRVGLQHTQQRAYDWGIFFGNDEKTRTALRTAGLPGDDPYERLGLGRLVRSTNLLTVKVH